MDKIETPDEFATRYWQSIPPHYSGHRKMLAEMIASRDAQIREECAPSSSGERKGKVDYKFEVGDAAIYIDSDGVNHGWVSIMGREPGENSGYWIMSAHQKFAQFVSEKCLYTAREATAWRKKNDGKKEMA